MSESGDGVAGEHRGGWISAAVEWNGVRWPQSRRKLRERCAERAGR